MSRRLGSSAAFEILRTAGRAASRRNVWSRSLSVATAVPSTPKRSRASAAASAGVNVGGAAVRTSSIAMSVTMSA
jgi:hypothetical protein